MAEEYFRDYHVADLRATILNASGVFSKFYTPQDLLGERATTEAPPESNTALRKGLVQVGKNHAKK